jgi:hypothetical protein
MNPDLLKHGDKVFVKKGDRTVEQTYEGRREQDPPYCFHAEDGGQDYMTAEQIWQMVEKKNLNP